MIIKKFQGKTEEEATALARAEMGDGVVIMNARQIKRKGLLGIFKRPIYEVTAAMEEAEKKPVKKEETKPAENKPAEPLLPPEIIKEASPKTEDDNDKKIEAKLENLSSLIEQKLLSDTKDEKKTEELVKEKPNDAIAFLKLIYNTLISNEVDERYINDLLDDLDGINRPGAMVDSLLPDIYQKLILKFGQSVGIAPAKEGSKAIFFVGPTGVGKTTTVAKLASKLSVVEHKKVALLTTDTYRIAATDQLKTYASILEIPFRIIYTADEMVKAYEDFSDYDYLLVDTAGHSPNNEAQFQSTREFLKALDGKCEQDYFLVLSVTTKYKDLIKISEMYSAVCKYKLIFTKLDETDDYGVILNIKLRTGAPMSYVTTGQNVPDDIEKFNPQPIVRGLLES